MDLKGLYDITGGDYGEAIGRFMSEARLEKFTRMFINDPSFGELEAALAVNDYSEAFRAVHTLKGVCLNMSFTGLFGFVNEATEVLRYADPQNQEDRTRVESCMEPLRKSYRELIEAIHRLDS